MDDFYADYRKEWRDQYDIAKYLRNTSAFFGVLALLLGLQSLYFSQEQRAPESSVIIPVYRNYPLGSFTSGGRKPLNAGVRSVAIRFERGSHRSSLHSLRGALIYIYYFVVLLLIHAAAWLYMRGQTKFSSYTMKLLAIALAIGWFFPIIDASVIMPHMLEGVNFKEFNIEFDEIAERNKLFYSLFLLGMTGVWRSSGLVSKIRITPPSPAPSDSSQ